MTTALTMHDNTKHACAKVVYVCCDHWCPITVHADCYLTMQLQLCSCKSSTRLLQLSVLLLLLILCTRPQLYLQQQGRSIHTSHSTHQHCYTCHEKHTNTHWKTLRYTTASSYGWRTAASTYMLHMLLHWYTTSSACVHACIHCSVHVLHVLLLLSAALYAVRCCVSCNTAAVISVAMFE
jgi:hypothetical protein